MSEWRGDVLFGRDKAVGGHYILAYAQMPELANQSHQRDPQRMMLWHANYHPDGGQLFYPLDKRPFMVPMALPGDEVQPSDFVCFLLDGSQGLYIHLNIWHEGMFTFLGWQRFFYQQVAVHAGVSVDFPREFGRLLEAAIPV